MRYTGNERLDKHFRGTRYKDFMIYKNGAKSLIDRQFGWQKTFKCLCHQTYILPYIKRRVKRDWGIEMKYPTHLKSLWVREAK